MAKLLVNVRRKDRGFAGSSLRKIANKLCKTANRQTATNRSKVITREIRPVGYYSRKRRKQAREEAEEGREVRVQVVTRSSFANFRQQNQVTAHRECNLERSARNSITLPTILTFALLSVLSVFTETSVSFKLFCSNFLLFDTDNIRLLCRINIYKYERERKILESINYYRINILILILLNYIKLIFILMIFILFCIIISFPMYNTTKSL